MNIKACMGGWCALRDRCQHYHAAGRREPSERLCIPGRDGESDVVLLTAPESNPAAPPAPPSQQVGE